MQCALPSCSAAATRKCAACKSLGYCSREHQRSDWKDHKKVCQRIVEAEAASGEGGAAGGGASDSALEGKDAGGGDGGEVAEQPTSVTRHDTLRAMMKEDAFDINMTPCGPHGESALGFSLSGGDEPIDEDAVKLVLGVPGLDIHVTTPEGQAALFIQCNLGRSRNVELLLADGRIDPNQRSTGTGESPLFTAANQGMDLCVKLLLADPRVDPNLANLQGYTPLNAAANLGEDGCVALLLADERVDVNRASAARGMTPLVSACVQLGQTFDQVGAPEPPTRCLVLLLKSRRITPYYMKESIAFLRQRGMPTRRQIATAEAGGKPLAPFHKTTRLLMPVLEAELRGEHRWCAWCHKLTPDRDLDKCAGCNEVSYCRPLNRRQLEGGHYSAGMSAEEIERRQREIADCQRLDWKAEHKHDCARFKAEAEAAKEAETKAGAAGGGRSGEGAAGGGGGFKPAKIKPNEKCPCGSGKKYKKCHGAN
jgi:hypothetical protein